jgi:hypothetical protein
MVSLVPWTTLTVGVAVSQWPDTMRIARGACLPAMAAGSHDLKKLRAGTVSSTVSVTAPWDKKKVSMASSTGGV